VIDLHCHILPGIDDGPPDLDGSLAMARAHVAAGIQRVAATPHVTWDIPTEPGTIRLAAAALNRALRDEDLPLEVLTGAEIGLTRAAELDDEQLRAFALGGPGGWLLVEAPLRPMAGVAPVVQSLQLRGHRVMLGHPERSPVFQRDPRALADLVRGGVLTQVTAGSLAGRFGSTVQRFCEQLVREDLVHNVSSDAHDAVRRAPGLRGEIEAAGFGVRARWWTEEVPAAMLAGDRIPPPPANALPRPRGGWLRRASRRR
jgi:protein-tyrosine phosphatase